MVKLTEALPFLFAKCKNTEDLYPKSRKILMEDLILTTNDSSEACIFLSSVFSGEIRLFDVVV